MVVAARTQSCHCNAYRININYILHCLACFIYCEAGARVGAKDKVVVEKFMGFILGTVTGGL